MGEWYLQNTNQYSRDFGEYEKKHPNELAAIITNFNCYFETLRDLGNPLQVTHGFIHHEPEGIKAIDQKGGCKKNKLQQTRLYIFPHIETKTLYLLGIGNKTAQKEDIKKCRDFVRKIKAGGESNDQEI